MKINNFLELVLLTTKVSDGNMSLLTGEKGGVKNREKFLKSVNLKFDDLVVLRLQHRDKVYKVIGKDLGKGAKSDKAAIKADAAVTNKKNLYLCILTADCLPVSVYDPETKAVGLIHVSRHNIQKIIENTIDLLKKEFSVNPKNLIVNIGPSIGPCHYEVDLWRKSEEELIKSKVLKKNIYNPRICSFESKDYFSHRQALAKNLPDDRSATIFGMK